MTRRVLSAIALAAGVGLVVGCFELSGPPSDLSAISPIAVAWPSVVEGDVLRDADGNPAPLTVEAYDGDGNLVTDATVTFIELDEGLEVEEGGLVRGVERGDSPVRVVALVRRGEDALQTDDVPIFVVPRPDSVAPAQDTTFEAKEVPFADPTPIRTELVVRVFSRQPGAAALPVRSWIVRYELLDWPDGVNDERTAMFGDAQNALVAVDTTDATDGKASRMVELRTVLLLPVDGPTRQNVLVRVTVANTRPGNAPTVFTITLPFDREPTP